LATQLQVYREAARFVGDHTIDSLSEDFPLRYALDEAWVGGPTFVLRQAAWRFALVTETLTGSAAAPTPGFTRTFSRPSTWLRTHSIFSLSGSRECPIDVREQNVSWISNSTTFTLRYVSDFYLDPTRWTEHFSKAVAAYMAFDVVDKISGDPARRSQMWELFQEFLRNAMEHDAVPEDPWLTHQFDGSFLASSKYILAQGTWGFAQKTATLTASGTAQAGLTRLYAKPADLHTLSAAFVLDTGNRQCPVDIREAPTTWSATTPSTSLVVRYVSTDGLDSTTWPEPFMRAVGAHLGINYGDFPVAQQDGQAKATIWPQYLAAALEAEATPISPWLDHQMDGSFVSASRNMLTQGFWNFALKTATPSTSGTAVTGFTTSFAKPADWMRTHSIFKATGSKEVPLDCREQGGFWSANETIRVRYISSDYLDSTTWPEEFMRVVAAYLGMDWGDGNARAVTSDGQGGQKQVLWPQYLQQALSNISLRPSSWLQFQLNGSFAHAVDKMLESGLWKFAIATTSLTSAGASTSPSYAYFFTKPTGWIRTVQVYEQLGTPSVFPTTDCDIDFRDEGGKIHANVTPIILRYLSSTLGRAPENWSDDFMEALLAYMTYQQAVADPQTSGAGLQAKLAAYKEAEKNARIKDEMRERPKMFTIGVLRRSRGGFGSGYRREQGWW